MFYVGLGTAEGLDDKFFHVISHVAHIIALSLQHFKDLPHTSLITNILLVITFVKLKLLAELINRIISQMHIGV